MEKPSVFPEILPGTSSFGHFIKPSPSCFVRIPIIITVRGAWKLSVFPEIPPGTYPLWSPDQTRLLPGLCEYLSSSLSEEHGASSSLKFHLHLSSLVTSSKTPFVRIPLIITVRGGMESSPSSLKFPSGIILFWSPDPTPPPLPALGAWKALRLPLKFHLELVNFGHLIKPVSLPGLCEYTLIITIRGAWSPSVFLKFCLRGMESPPSSLKFPLGLIHFGHLIKPSPSALCDTSHHHCQMGMESLSVFPEIPPGTYPLWSLHQTRLLFLLCANTPSSSLSEGHGKPSVFPEIPPGLILWSLHQTRLLPGLGQGKPSVFPEIPPDLSSLVTSSNPVSFLPVCRIPLIPTVRGGMEKPSKSSLNSLGLILFGHLIKPVSFLLCAYISHHHSEGHGKSSVFLKFPLGLILFDHLDQNLSPSCFCANTSLIITVRGAWKDLRLP
ncbi:unnamed protein product [Acanthosepion pharaonis]|uniref:Uncharacterized protein n=1 Tax=Acanthosepion pharaonis TaxID=158019 RepID=A0A812CIZ6_ACAPH|nr:unnamed protein product [Sepia pharaonis]